MSRVRPPSVARLFYPSEPRELEREIDSYLRVTVPEGEPLPKALIVPHAGYVYSGPTAGAAFARLGGSASVIERVVLVGPAHRALIRGLATSSADSFASPLGLVRIDDELRRRALEYACVSVDDIAHAAEHSLEVQLPFLQRVLGRFTLLPLVVGDAAPDEVGAVLDAVWGGDETLVVVSSDLSHYHDYDTARRRDARTAAAIVSGNGDTVADADACGARPIRGLLATARARTLGIRLIDLRNSGDTAGDRSRVVGYGAFAIA